MSKEEKQIVMEMFDTLAVKITELNYGCWEALGTKAGAEVCEQLSEAREMFCEKLGLKD